MIRWAKIAAAYAGLGAVSLALIWPRGSPLEYPRPRLALGQEAAQLWSLGLGLAVGVALIVSSRISVQRYAWARRLHLELRPFAQTLSPTAIIVLGLLSSGGEELLFRGLLQPWMGLLPQALLFGFLHQVPGRSRWVWASWAFLVGLTFGAMFEITGSLLGPLLAHALVNGVNLNFLKRHDPSQLSLPPRLELRA
jgi:membrane protease YdiL (CAAX protease family)